MSARELFVAVVRQRERSAIATLAFALLLAAGLPRIRFDASNEALYRDDDQTLVTYRQFKDRFGTDEVVYVLVELEDAFAEPELSKLIRLGSLLQQLPQATRVRSPIHSPVAYLDAEGTLVSKSLAQARPATDAERREWRERVLGYEPFQDLLISKDGRWLGFSVQLRRDLDHASRTALADAVDQLRRDEPLRSWKHAATGTAINPVHIARILQREMARSLVAAVLVAVVTLGLLFRRALPVAGALLQIGLLLVGTLGLMGWLDQPLSSISLLLPVLLACVGLADCMHVLAAHQRLVVAGMPAEEAAVQALSETWWPCLVTSLTNMGGFLALSAAPLAPIATLGRFAAAGTVLAYLLLIGLTPLVLGGWAPRPGAEQGEDRWARVLLVISRVPIRRPWPVLVVGLSLLGALAAGIPRLGAEQHIMRDLDRDEPLRRDLDFIHERMGGTISVEVVVEPDDPDDPEQLAEVLRRCDFIEPWMEQVDPAVRSVLGIVDGVRQIHHLFDGPRAVPDDPNAAAQLLLALQSADADYYEQYLTVGGRALRISVRCDLVSSAQYEVITRKVEDELSRTFDGVARAYMTGGALLLAHTNDYILTTQRESFGWSLLVVAVIVLLSVRRPVLGLLSLVPNVGPVVAMLGLMGWLGIPLEVATALIATVALGIVVDDTVHVVHSFAEEAHQGTPAPLAIERVLQRTGRAVLFTSVVLVLGFATYLGSSLRPIRTFGWLAGATFLVAFLADLLILPALLRVLPAPRPRETGPEA